MKRLGLALVAVALCFAAARPAMAQAVGSLRWGVNAGVLLPMGTYGDGDKMGFVGGLGATYWLPAGSIGVRGDLSYAQTSHDGVSGNTKIMGGMASLVYALNPANAPARIMISGGVGMFNVKESVTSASETKIGFGGGAAVAFKMGTGSTRLVLGTRFTSVSTSGSSITFLPITVGLTFGK